MINPENNIKKNYNYRLLTTKLHQRGKSSRSIKGSISIGKYY